MNGPQIVPYRGVGEWALALGQAYDNPFVDVIVDAEFTAPSGARRIMPAFYDGGNTWRVRFSPDEAGTWRLHIRTMPREDMPEQEAIFQVTPREARGTLCATPGEAWGFAYSSGEPAFLLGDTVYNLFGMAHCGGDVEGFMRRRAGQGINLLRVRVPVSPFHPPRGYSDWQTRRTWPWGGSEQAPQFDRFNLDYFGTVDRVVREAESLGLGLEMIMEGWGFEFPFARRDVFLPEWEDLWMRYLIARYDAFNCVFIWTLMNEYEFYPDGDWRYSRISDLWAMRRARWVKALAPHGHVVAVHNGPRLPRFADRFRRDPGAIDAIMFQDWGSRDEEHGWLADGIEDIIAAALDGWWGSAVFAEWGYERNPALELKMPSHLYCDVEHTRRGAWRGAFCGLGIIHGFENSWGPWMLLDEDQPGLAMLQRVHHFFTQVAPFTALRPAADLVTGGPWPRGCRPLALASEDGALAAVYLPVGGEVALALPRGGAGYVAEWYCPVNGTLRPAQGGEGHYVAPPAEHLGHPQDWVLLLRAT
ncbi:MAG: DUF4038 domain-containing protein [Chloroflexi bacterium]|nr:DUF4038 domain-containing protein [Chloroflexota bacterium]